MNEDRNFLFSRRKIFARVCYLHPAVNSGRNFWREMTNMIKKLYLQTHVTALCTVEPHFLLEGCGGFINLYDFNSNKLLESLDIFRGARIHGIQYSLQNRTLIVFGGKLLALVSFNDSETTLPRLKILQKSNENDWIRDAKFVNNGDYLVKLTSHNKVVIQKTSLGAEIIEVQGDEQCILYCGKILGEDVSQLTILAGTVFGSILVWAASLSQKDKCLFHRLTGHNGVIFSINYDEISRTIISTSDDRAVRTWSLQCEDEEPTSSNLWSVFRRSKIDPKYELYGHEARVWNSVIIRQNQFDSGLIASLGEDSRICLWDLTSGKLVSKFDAHPGTSVWAAVWDSRLQLLVTAGGEGSTRIWNANHFEETSCRQLKLPEDRQVPRLVIVTSTGYYRYLVSSQLGIIYGWNSHAQVWASLFQDERLGNGSVLDSDGRTILFGTRTGAVFVFVSGPSSLELQATHQLEKSKIYSVHLVASQQQLMACLDNGRLVLMNILDGSSESESQSRTQFILPEGKQRWPSCVLATQNRFMMGDREGSFHLYSTEKETPLQSFPHVHGKNGLTDVQGDPLGQHLYYTAGKDGRVGLWRLTDDGNQLELLSLTNTSLGWIARLRWIDRQLTYLAFQSDRFVVWSSQQQRSLMQVPCGGGHRSWDFDVTSSDVTLLFIKDKHIYENRRQLSGVFSSSLPGRRGGHSKSICRGKFLGSCNPETPLVLTGSEDTTMRLSRLEERSAQSLAVVTQHVSSVRALAVKELRCGSGTWLCVSAGGRAQLAVGLLTLSGQGHRVHVIHRDVRSHFLRGWLRRATTAKPWIHGGHHLSLIPDPETRYMDADVVDRGDGNFHIIAACSDSFIRIFDLSLEDRKLDLFQELNFHNCCVLLVKIVEDAHGNSILLSAGTDGRLAVWNVTLLEEDKAMDPVGSLLVHQSGINSLDCQWIDLDRLLILTGGDDNALICSKVEISCEKSLLLLIHQEKQFPHAAQISGVALLRQNLCLSVSLDQRLILWKREDTRLRWLSAVCCDVSDIQGLDVSAGDSKTLTKVLVYGQGIQVFEVDESPSIILHHLRHSSVDPLSD